MARTLRITVPVAILFASLAFLPHTTHAAQINISIANMAFSPSALTVNAGDTVAWTNNDSVAHTVTADDGSFNSGTVQPGQTYTHLFTSSGAVSYHCALHPSMTGTVSIAASAAAGNSGNAADLKAQAQALLNRITALQAQLGGSTTAPSGVTLDSSACPLIGRSLKKGSSGDDVSRLQQFLARDTAIYPEAQVSGYYGALTEAAVKRWQVKYNIVSTGDAATTGYGVVGPRTAAAIALVCSTLNGGGAAPGTQSGANVGGYIQVTPISGPVPLAVKVIVTVNTVNSCTGGSYQLDYGDGTLPNTITVPAGNCQQQVQTLGHSYLYGGNYQITLSAGSHRTSASVIAYGPGPSQGVPGVTTPSQNDSLSASPTSGTAPLSVTFSGVINGAQACGGGSYNLQFGDGQSVPLTFDSATCSARSFSVSHQYQSAARFSAKLYKGTSTSALAANEVFIDVSGGTATTPMTVVPGIGGNPLAAQAQFDGGCSSYTIDWGDGATPATGTCGTGAMTVGHTYSLNGSYTVTLTRGSRVDTAGITIQ